MVVEVVIGAIGLISLIYPAISALNSRTWGVIDELIKTNRAAKDPKLFRQLRDELATWDELLKSIDRVKGSDDTEDRALSAVRSHCEEYETVLSETLEYLRQFRDTYDRKEMSSIIVDLRHQFKSVRRHRRKVQKWIGDINMIIVSRIHEELNRQHKTNSEALKAQSQTLENMQINFGQELLGIRHRIEELGASLKSPRGHEADDLQIESASTVTDLAGIADDMISIWCGRETGSLVSRTTGVSLTSDFRAFGSEIGARDLFNGPIKESGSGSSATVSQGTQTTLVHPSDSIAADLTVSNTTTTSPRFPFEQVYDDESDSETESENESFSEARTDSSFTIDHLDDGIEVLDRTQPEEYLDQYTASNAILKKLKLSITKECNCIAAGSFGQATRGGPEVLTMQPAEWGNGVIQRFRSLGGDSIGIAFERDWEPFQSNPGLATLSSTCKAHHLVRKVSFITRTLTDLDFYDLRPGLTRGAGGFFAWNMTENCTYGECERNLDLLCAESLIKVGEDSSRWESTIFCITVPWVLYRFWTTIRGHSEHEPSGVSFLVDQGLLAEMPVKITAEDGQTWQRLWCPETVEGAKEIRAMFHEFSLPKRCGSFMLPRRFIVVVYKTGTADEWVRSVYKSLNKDPSTQIHYLGSDGEFDPPFSLE